MKIHVLIPCIISIFLAFPQVIHAYPYLVLTEYQEAAIDSSFCSEIKYFLNTIDSNVIEEFFNDGFRLIVTEQDLNSLLFDGRFTGKVAGAFSPSKKRIYIDWRYYNYIPHEFGHYLDYKSGKPSRSNVFEQIKKLEISNAIKHGMVSGRQADNSSEYFAEMYMNLCLNPENAKSACPKTCEFILYYISII